MAPILDKVDVKCLDQDSAEDYYSHVPSKRKCFFDSVMCGNLHLSSIFQSVIVLAESWPSWVYSFGGLFGDVKVCVSCKDNLGFKILWFGSEVTWWDWSYWIKSWKDSCDEETKNLFCVQGCLGFVEDIWTNLLELNPLCTCVMACVTCCLSARLCPHHPCAPSVRHANCTP